MKLTYLGTAAAEGMPAVWCNCDACRAAKAAGGKNIRTRSQLLINDDLLLDLPMDTYLHVLQNGLDLSAVKTVLITHAHMDHCYPQELTLHGAPYAHRLTSPTLDVYGNHAVLQLIRAHNAAEIHPDIAETVRLHAVKPYDDFTAEGYRVTALPAVHTKGEDCLIYLIQSEGKAVLLFNDSGILPDTVYDFLAQTGVRLDLVSFDCTYGNARHGAGRHMGLADNADEREKMARRGLVHEGTRYVLTHFSHNGGLLHEQLEAVARPLGFTVAYDGREIVL